MNTNWWESLETINEPYPHIPESKILEAMPAELHKAWGDFMYGQTCLALEKTGGSGTNGKTWESGIYTWDFERFIGKLKRNQPLKDTVEEWD